MYQDKVNLAMMPVHMGMQAAAKTAGFNQDYSSSAGNLMNQMGEINAAKAAIPYQTMSSIMNTGMKMFGLEDLGGMNMGKIEGWGKGF